MTSPLPLLIAAVLGQNPKDVVPTLQTVATAAVVNGEVWFHPGELLVGNPSLAGRPAVRPLQGNAPFMLPTDLSEYEMLSRTCPTSREEAQAAWSRTALAPEPPVLTRGDLGGDGVVESVAVERVSATTAPSVRVSRGKQLLASVGLPVSIWPCGALITEVDADDTPDLILVWASWGANGRTVGVNVYQVPAAK